MSHANKTKGQLIEELAKTEARVAELEALASNLGQAGGLPGRESILLRTLMDNLPDYIFLKDRDSRFIMNNAAHLHALGVASQDQVLGKTDMDIFPQELAAQYYADEQKVIRTGQPVIGREELVVDQMTGERKWVLTAKAPVRDARGEIIGLVGISRDITARKEAAAALERAYAEVEKRVEERTAELQREITEREQIGKELAFERELLRALMDNLPDAIYFKDADSRFIRINRSQTDRFSLSDPEQAMGKSDFDFFTEEHARPAYEAEQEIIRTGQPLLNLEEKETWPDRPPTWVATTKMPLRDEAGNIIGTFGISRDITDRKRAEEALEKAYAEVEKQVEERTTALQRETAERERLQQEVIEAQRRALQELSTPIIPVLEGVIVMPLIGSVDTLRARDITRALLAGIREYRAKVVILDITGVPLVDSGVAAYLNRTIQAARLKGARAIVTGISDAVAETIVDLGIDWSGIETLSDLHTGLVVALNNLGFKLVKSK